MAYLDYNGLQRFKTNLDAQTNGLIAPVYDSTKTYDVGDYVIYNNDLYCCTTAITTAEAWTAAHWETVALADDVEKNTAKVSAINTTLGIIEPLVGSATMTSAYAETYALTNITFKEGKAYKVRFVASAPASAVIYTRIKNGYGGSNLIGGTIAAGSTTNELQYIASSDNNQICISATSGNAFSFTATVEEITNGNAFDALKEKTDSVIASGQYQFSGTFINGTLLSGSWGANVHRICTPALMTADADLDIYIENGYRIGIQSLVGAAYVDSGWLTSFASIKKGTQFKVVIAQNPDYSGTADIDTFKAAVKIDAYNTKNARAYENTLLLANPFRFKKYFSHIGVDKGGVNVIIPSQSIFDVERSKRLGFDVLEINVAKTSDNKYICTHGDNGKFGAAFEDTDGNSVATVAINSMTLQDIKDTIRYKSIYPKYRVAPPTLDEMLHECKRLNVIPLCQYADDTVIDTLNKIMGLNNYVLSVYTMDRSGKTNAPLASWLNTTTDAALIEKCKASGGVYIAGLNANDAAYSSFTDDDWTALIEAAHSNGFFVSFNSVYTGEVKAQKFMELGFDACGSGYNINEIESGNLCNLCAGGDFTDFTHNGTVTDGTLSLNSNQTVAPNATLNSVFLGGGSLHIWFNGTLTVQMGSHINADFTSDGSHGMWFSTFFEGAAPTFLLTAKENTTVYDICYKASRL